ncbi:MAG: ABC transporter permease [Propionibacteriales bacterium]|nr:ABC transporter permease [Propionibacteriales bacterium]
MTSPTPTAPQRRIRTQQAAHTWLLFSVAAIVLVAAVRVVTGANGIDSPGTIQAAIIATCPILMAGLGGLWSERSGVVNIGLEGQMILGTWGSAYFTYYYGPWAGVAGAALLGAIGGLLHAVATVTFGVDHIVSGVAINIIAAGAAQFLAEAYFQDLEGGGFKQLTGLDKPASLTIPGMSDAMNSLAERHWFLVSDLASFVAALTDGLSLLTVLIGALVAASAWILWRTPFGLRLRSCGENPAAAESLGVNVYTYKYIAVVVSGAMAGIGGCFLTLVSSSGFTVGQTGGRGYIGLAAMIFGNWHPGGVVAGSLMFGYTDSLRLRDAASVHALLLVLAVVLVAVAVWRGRRAQTTGAVVTGVLGLGFAVWFLLSNEVPRDFTGMTPYVATLLVLALAAQRLRMPAADGLRYRRGQSI